MKDGIVFVNYKVTSYLGAENKDSLQQSRLIVQRQEEQKLAISKVQGIGFFSKNISCASIHCLNVCLKTYTSNNSPCGMTVWVNLDPAVGAMVLQWMLYFRPSIAIVFDRPKRPSFAAL